VVYLIPKSAQGQAILFGAPRVALDLGDFSFRLTEKFPGFWRLAVNEFGSQFNGAVTTGVEVGQHPTADTITSFDDVHSNAGAAQLACRGQSCYAGANHDYGRI